jgi:hypothetical protein
MSASARFSAFAGMGGAPQQRYARELICFASAAVAPMRVVIAAVGRLGKA